MSHYCIYTSIPWGGRLTVVHDAEVPERPSWTREDDTQWLHVEAAYGSGNCPAHEATNTRRVTHLSTHAY